MAQMPEIGAKKYAGNDPAMKQVWNYIYQLEEQLRYAFNHIGADNIEEGAVTGKHIEAETITADRLSASAGNDLNITGNRAVLLTAKKQSEADGKIAQLRVDTDAIAGRVSDAEGNISQIRQTAEGLESRVTSAETSITQNAEQIALRATKTDVTTAVSGVQEGVDANADAIGALQTRTTAAETQIAQNATEISLRATKTEMEGLQIGGTNLFTGTRNFSGDAWINKDAWSEDAEYKGFSVLIKDSIYSGLTQEITVAAGEKYVYSCYAKQYSGGQTRFYCLIPGATSITDKDGFIVTAIDLNWRRIEIAFTVLVDGIILPRLESTIADKRLYVCGIKLEKGTKATDWSPSPEDPARSVKTSSVTVNGSGIWLDSTGEISLAAGGKINIQSGADEGNQILLGDLFSATDQGGVTGKTANFGSLLVGGNPAAALGGNIVVATAQPSGNGILWLKPNSVATVQYQRATPSTRSWWLNGTRVIESIAAKTTDVLPGGTIHYKLTLPLYALSRLEGVVVAPRLSKSGISGEVALGAQTISILGLNVLTLEGASAINLGAAPGTPITLTLDVTNGDGQKLFVQSDTTIQLEISNRTVASGGVQALEAYWIP